MERSDFFVERSDYLWNEVTIFWNEVTVRWNEVTWNEVTMERSDRNSITRLTEILETFPRVFVFQSRVSTKTVVKLVFILVSCSLIFIKNMHVTHLLVSRHIYAPGVVSAIFNSSRENNKYVFEIICTQQ